MKTRGRPKKYNSDKERLTEYAKRAREKYAVTKTGEVREYIKSEIVEKHRGTPWYAMYHRMKTRAKKNNWDFDITIEWLADLWIKAEVCPLLDIPYKIAEQHPHNKSVDRIDSNRGYTKDNVWIVSRRSNTIKNDASIEELLLITENLKSKLGDDPR